MGYWNYRVLRSRCEVSGEDLYRVHEVHYDDAAAITYWSAVANTVCGESLVELGDNLSMQRKALGRPVLVEREQDGKLTLVEAVD